MKIRTIFLLIILAVSAMAALGQSAAPLRIEFAKGKTSAVSSDTVKTGEEVDFVFGAKAGQKVTLKVTSIPKGNYVDFTLKGDEVDFHTELDSYNSYSFTAPETGDYLVTVRKRPTNKLPKAKFFLTTTIK